MSTQETSSTGERRKPPLGLEARVAAARAVVTASKNTGRPVAPHVQALAETDLPGNPYVPAFEPSRWRRFVAALFPDV